jgi:hypothetical protein
MMHGLIMSLERVFQRPLASDIIRLASKLHGSQRVSGEVGSSAGIHAKELPLILPLPLTIIASLLLVRLHLRSLGWLGEMMEQERLA